MRTKEAAAAIIARDHYRYCRQRGDSLRDIAESVGYRMQPDEGEDDVILLLERRWLQQWRPGDERE